MTTQFILLTEPTIPIVEAFNRWESNPFLIPFTRPHKNKEELENVAVITEEDLSKRLENHHIYLIYHDGKLVGEMNYMVDPGHLYKKEPGTAWIGITIGEQEGRDKGIGVKAMQYIEDQIKKQGLKRIELGVFEFNMQAQKLYHKLGYQEIARLEEFTYWQGKMWADIRMEKYLM
ncbi:GNAT family N-acetyltransferase [Pontibacillus yanchengensis]|uniref:N-acetyltransferase domain-containing protein n=1 Tax=Pontibacillus yanchengensis Y32 TaxID=1385514 RepID=A0A0A2TCA8_9BACI|nr:GNAT family N-acetyltransferase [Pontibacillus yanchengensis]KGP73442.1 hypothetical protein N782_05245 [Pontibacillus yanchengensis Y32]